MCAYLFSGGDYQTVSLLWEYNSVHWGCFSHETIGFPFHMFIIICITQFVFHSLTQMNTHAVTQSETEIHEAVCFHSSSISTKHQEPNQINKCIFFCVFKPNIFFLQESSQSSAVWRTHFSTFWLQRCCSALNTMWHKTVEQQETVYWAVLQLQTEPLPEVWTFQTTVFWRSVCVKSSCLGWFLPL